MDKLKRRPSLGEFHVKRYIYLQDQLNEEMGFEPTPPFSVITFLKNSFQKKKFRKFVRSVFPFVKWMPYYSFRKYLLNDLSAGFTLGLLHVFHGMGTSLMLGTEMGYSYCTAFFPVLLYVFLSTSRHGSAGTQYVSTMMCANLINENPDIDLTRQQFSSLISFTVGVTMIVLSIFRFAIFVNLLSDALISAYLSACGLYVMFHYWGMILGITEHMAEYDRFSIVKITIGKANILEDANLYGFAVAVALIAIFLLIDTFAKTWLHKTVKFPILPYVIVVVAFELLGRYLHLKEKTKWKTINIPNIKYYVPRVPDLHVIPKIYGPCFILLLTSYFNSMCAIIDCAKVSGYKIHPSQELLAIGVCNVFGSFFNSYPMAISFERSFIIEEHGGYTQVTSIISCIIVAILFCLPIFLDHVPVCVFATIALYLQLPILKKIYKAKDIWYLNKWDFLVWISTFLSTLFIGLDIGLTVGLIMSFLSLFLRDCIFSYSCLLGKIPGTNIYVNVGQYNVVQEEDVKIYKFYGRLNYFTRKVYKDSLYDLINLDVDLACNILDTTGKLPPTKLKCIILDFSAFVRLDSQVITTLKMLEENLAKLNILMYIARCSTEAFEMIIRTKKYIKTDFVMFPSVHDAYEYYKQNVAKEKI